MGRGRRRADSGETTIFFTTALVRPRICQCHAQGGLIGSWKIQRHNCFFSVILCVSYVALCVTSI
jgi:hypothetical protein